MIILGISGKRGVGKTMFASHLVRNAGFTKVSFAEELKILAKKIFRMTDADMSIPSVKEKKYKNYDWSPREFLIHLGEFIRFHDEEYFIKEGLSKCTLKGGAYVFDDVRYKNEYDVLKKIGAKIIRINRYPANNPYGKDLDTRSETELDKEAFDYVIESARNTTPKQLTDHTKNVLDLFGDK